MHRPYNDRWVSLIFRQSDAFECKIASSRGISRDHGVLCAIEISLGVDRFSELIVPESGV